MQRIHYLVKIPLPRSLCGSVDTPKLDQFFKLKLDVVLTSMESKFGFHPHGETVENPAWLYPEAQSAALEELHVNDLDHFPWKSVIS